LVLENSPHESEMRWYGLRVLVSIRFQVYFTALAGLLFTFPSRYLFTIDRKVYLAFPDSPGCFLRRFHLSKYSRSKHSKRWVLDRALK